jgi:hypothetical protein
VVGVNSRQPSYSPMMQAKSTPSALAKPNLLELGAAEDQLPSHI